MTVQGRGQLPAEVRGGRYRPRRGSGGSVWRGVLVVGVLAAVVIVGATLLAGPLFRDFARNMARDNPQTIGWPFVADVVKADLGDSLEEPAGADATPIAFTIPVGASVSRIARDLVEDGLLADVLVFHYLVVTQDVESAIQTGTFTLTATMTPQQIVDRLQLPPDPPPAQVTVSLRTGDRIAHIAAILEFRDLEMDVGEFYEMATDPPAWVRQDYPWTEVIPEGNSLEGFLPTGVYQLEVDDTAEDFLRVLLDTWEGAYEAYIAQAEELDKDFYDVMILASIVEKEAALEEERPLIAGAYQNRLDGKAEDGVRLLNADPTVIYANDTMRIRELELAQWPDYSFWELIPDTPRLVDFVPSEDLRGYQTYQVPGLPPTPIASPAAASIEAALDPDTETGYIYFVACGDQAHRFAKTFAEHNRNRRQCQG